MKILKNVIFTAVPIALIGVLVFIFLMPQKNNISYGANARQKMDFYKPVQGKVKKT